jgi:hypothetical protein
LRELALDYGVSHTALSRYFARPEARRQLKQAEQLLRAERRAAAAGRQAKRRAEREVRRQAREQAALERELLRQSRAVQARIAARRHRPSGYEAWFDDNDLRRPLTRAELYSRNDDTAARIVAAGGGIEAVVEATGLRSRENVLAVIDPATLVRAFRNDAAAPAVCEPDRERLRRLVPDRELVHRRAQGETLRQLACDYGVAHTTLGRYFARPQVARQLKQTSRQPSAAAKSRSRPLAASAGSSRMRVTCSV